jgi:hypothetical protein
MELMLYLVLFVARATTAASLVTARISKLHQTAAVPSVLSGLPPTILSGRDLPPAIKLCKDGFCKTIPKKCEEERDKFSTLMTTKQAELATLYDQCNQEIEAKKKEQAFEKQQVETLKKQIKDKQNEIERLGYYHMRYGNWMCERLRQGFIMKPANATAHGEFAKICNGSLKLQDAAAYGQGTGISMPAHRSPFVAHFWHRKTLDMPALTEECRTWAGPVHEELRKSTQEYESAKKDCEAARTDLQRKVDKLKVEKDKLAVNVTSLPQKGPAIRACMANYIQTKFCNDKILKKPSCDCPCAASAAEVYWREMCPLTQDKLPIPSECVKVAGG